MAQLNHYVVTVEIPGRYWSIQMFVDDETPENAMRQAEDQFKQAVELGYVVGTFRATNATPVEEFLK